MCFGDIFFLFSNDCVEFLLLSGFFSLPSGLGFRVLLPCRGEIMVPLEFLGFDICWILEEM